MDDPGATSANPSRPTSRAAPEAPIQQGDIPPRSRTGAPGERVLVDPETLELIRAIVRPEGSARALKSVLKMKEPEFYYGKSPKEYYDWTRYIEKYYAGKSLEADINDHAKVVYAATFLKGDLESKWERHTKNTPPETMTWQDYKTWLHDQLENPIHREWTVVMKLEDLQQKPNQSVSSFASIFNDLRTQAAPHLKDDERYWMKVLFSKLRPELRKKIQDWPTMPTRLVDLEAQAERLEQQERKRNRESYSKPLPTTSRWTNNGSDKATTSFSALPSKRKTDPEQTSATNKRQKTQWQGNKGAQNNVTCYTCGKRGHYARDCRSRGKGNGNGPKSSGSTDTSNNRPA